jgi:hypothetical protein
LKMIRATHAGRTNRQDSWWYSMRFIESSKELYCEKRSRPGSVGGHGWEGD